MSGDSVRHSHFNSTHSSFFPIDKKNNQDALKKLMQVNTYFFNDDGLSTEKNISHKKITDRLPIDQMMTSGRWTTVSGMPKRILDSLTRLKELFSELNNRVVRNPVILNDAMIRHQGMTDSSYVRNNAQYYYSTTEFSASWFLAGIPVNVLYRNQTWTDVNGHIPDNFSVQYDKDNYISQLKKKLTGKFNPADLLPRIENPTAIARQKAEQLLKSELDALNSKYETLLADKMQQVGDVKNLFNKDIGLLRQQLLSSEYIQAVQDKENLLAQLQNKKNMGESVSMEQMNVLQQSVKEMKGVQELLTKIESHKKNWESSGLLTKMKEWDILQKQKLQQIMNDPATTIKMARRHLNLNSFQKFFLKVNKLNIGQNAFSASPLSVQHFLNKGVVTEFLNNNRYLLLIAGKQQDMNFLQDIPFTNPIFSGGGNALGFRVGKGNTTEPHSHVSIMTYNQTVNAPNMPAALNTIRRSLVTTISNQLKIGQNGLITTEISRSAMDYSFNKSLADSGQSQTGFEQMFSVNDFMKNTAFSLKYEDEFSKSGLSYQVHINKTANGYNNPGNAFLNAGSKELGMNIRKSLWKKKLQVSFRADVREFNYSEDPNKKWQNLYAAFDARWRMKKGQYLGFRYIPNRMFRVEDGNKFTTTSLDRLSLEGNLAKKLGKLYYRNYLNLAYQKNMYSFLNSAILNRTVMFSSYQSVTINKQLVYINLNYNHADNNYQFAYFNSSLVAESGTSYMVFKKITASSAVTYNSIKGWYQQVGIRQTLSGQLGERFVMDIYLDARKNIKLDQPLLVGLVRADVGIHYLLKK